jgi:hypothetical protein
MHKKKYIGASALSRISLIQDIVSATNIELQRKKNHNQLMML